MGFVSLEKIGNVKLTFNISKAVSMSILEMGLVLGQSMIIISSFCNLLVKTEKKSDRLFSSRGRGS